MGVLLEFNHIDANQRNFHTTITDECLVTLEREYITNFTWIGRMEWENTVAGTVVQHELQNSITDINEYTCILIDSTQNYQQSYNGGTGSALTVNVDSSNRPTEHYTMHLQFFTPLGWAVNISPYLLDYSITTNIPIFTESEYYNIYKNNQKTLEERNEALTHALNYDRGELPPLQEYFYYGQAEQYIVDEFGNVSRTNANPIYRGIRVKSRERCSLYEIDGINDGVLKMGMNLQGIEIAYYSTDGGDTWQNMAGSPTSLPFDYLYRNWKDEVGTFWAYSVTGADIDTNMYIYHTKAESDTYNGGGDNEEDASNYAYISSGQEPKNRTGEPDEETEFGQIGIHSSFSQQYILSSGAMSEIANALFDVTQGGITGIFEDIKKGCEMYGDSVIDDIESLYFYPVDLTQVFAGHISSQNHIYFGGYRFGMTNAVNKIVYPNGYYDFGSFQIETTFGENIRSYEPYTKLYCYLAYIGWVQLDMKKYLHKTVNIRYYIDTRSGGCIAVLLANGVMCDFYNGQIGVSQPLKATDFNAYANAQIQTLLGFGKGMAGQGQNVGNVASQMSKAGASAGELAVGGVALAGAGASVQGAKTLYGLTQNNINNFNHTIGGSSSMLNMFLPQECCFMFEVQEAMPTEYERELVGLPSNASGTVGSFTGYLECEQVNLVCSGATAKEQSEILRYLYGGIYI